MNLFNMKSAIRLWLAPLTERSEMRKNACPLASTTFVCAEHYSLFVWLYKMSSEAKQMCCNSDSQYVPRHGTEKALEKN
jgi:hypothetical protein